jgi:hypothetical protein
MDNNSSPEEASIGKTKLVGKLVKQRSQKTESDIENSKHKLKEHQDKHITTMFMISLAQNKPKT